jgi:hypothetical protein
LDPSRAAQGADDAPRTGPSPAVLSRVSVKAKKKSLKQELAVRF